jgi:SPP1 gp7 family putative phage head morphogenesis protein
VTKVGGLPLFARAVAHALLRAGHTESEAVQLAIGALQRWAHGGDHVTAKTQAKAAAALAEWEAKKAASHAKREDDFELRFDITTEARGPDGKWLSPRLNEMKTDLSTGAKRPLGDILLDVHKGQAERRKAMKVEAAARRARRKPRPVQEPKVVAEWNKGDPLPGHARIVNRQEHKVDGEVIGHVGEYHTGGGGQHSGKWYADHAGATHPIVFDSKAKAVDALERWHAAQHGVELPGEAKWLTGKRDGVGVAVTEAGSAGDLLPVGQPIGPKPREATVVGPHRFSGPNLDSCAKCGRPVRDRLHQPARRPTKGTRHRGPDGHAHVPTGHVAGNPVRRREAAKQEHVASLDTLEPHVTSVMAKLFHDQETSTLTRLNGNRGRQMINRALADLATRDATPNEPPTPPAGGGDMPAAPGPLVNPAAVFDATYWTDKTVDALTPTVAAVSQIGTARVRAQVGAPADLTGEADSLARAQVDQALAQRVADTARQVTATTQAQLTAELSEGVANGESTSQLADRVRQVLGTDTARSRAETIARTITNSTMNQAAHQYAAALPLGVVGGREWLAVHDDRTRETHRAADGQVAQMGAPFVVGGYPMQHPGDPAAPPEETVNCRCTVAYLPASERRRPAAPAAAAATAA